ncbi:acyltransferase family protein [Qipengyuania gaetbuli]|uniref:acyltransferase family protein n=1 Tax=Qipengyuania gaetbuli TaxID=266952 RepID=UPI001CD4E365|nr:acyltransferase [Qipengyuania gaetbuli]MCA0911013.1 acyltransferase [Qipengyuania gaetbuli]
MAEVETTPELRAKWVDIAKAISILLILLGHATQHVSIYTGEDGILHGFVTMLTPVRVPMFFFISGLFSMSFYMGHNKRITERLLQLSKVYAVWSILSLLFAKMLFPSAESHLAGLAFTDAVAEFILPSAFPWFLWALAIFNLVAAFGLRHVPLFTLLIAIGLSAALVTIPYDLPGTHAVGGVGIYANFLFFVLPFYVANARERIERLAPLRTACTAGIAYCALLFASEAQGNSWLKPAFTITATCAGIITLLCLARILENTGRVQLTMSYIGQKTLPIYVMHGLISLGMAKIAFGAGMFGSPLVDALVTIAIAGFSAGISVLIERLLPRSVSDTIFMPTRRKAGASNGHASSISVPNSAV